MNAINQTTLFVGTIVETSCPHIFHKQKLPLPNKRVNRIQPFMVGFDAFDIFDKIPTLTQSPKSVFHTDPIII